MIFFTSKGCTHVASEPSLDKRADLLLQPIPLLVVGSMLLVGALDSVCIRRFLIHHGHFFLARYCGSLCSVACRVNTQQIWATAVASCVLFSATSPVACKAQVRHRDAKRSVLMRNDPLRSFVPFEFATKVPACMCFDVRWRARVCIFVAGDGFTASHV